jgi:uncharacterized protein (UPF0335 family)
MARGKSGQQAAIDAVNAKIERLEKRKADLESDIEKEVLYREHLKRVGMPKGDEANETK